MSDSAPSLLFNKFWSEVHILPASKIPTSPSGSGNAPWKSYHLNKGKSPTTAETAYVVGANGGLELPSTAEFQEKSEQAMKVKSKFSLLKDVKDQCYCNILGEVIQVYDASSDGAVTVYFSDYTANSEFYNRPWDEGETSKSRDGDDYGYIKTRPKTIKDWPGPYGKMTIQLTLYDGHATFVREHVKAKHWVLLKNVQIKYGSMGGCLEGFLRGDRFAFEGKVQVEIMQQTETAEENDPRWREAVRRRSEYEKKFKHEKQALEDEASGKKRKRENELPKNSKERRKEKRAAAEGKAVATEHKVKAKLDLNENSTWGIPFPCFEG